MSCLDLFMGEHKEELPDGEAADFARRLSDAGEGRGEIVEIRVIVECDDRDIVGDQQIFFLERFHAAHGDRVGECKNGCRALVALEQ